MLRKLKQLKAKGDESIKRLQQAQEKRVTTIKVNKRTEDIAVCVVFYGPPGGEVTAESVG